jgi:hypothetical protein
VRRCFCREGGRHSLCLSEVALLIHTLQVMERETTPTKKIKFPNLTYMHSEHTELYVSPVCVDKAGSLETSEFLRF